MWTLQNKNGRSFFLKEEMKRERWRERGGLKEDVRTYNIMAGGSKHRRSKARRWRCVRGDGVCMTKVRAKVACVQQVGCSDDQRYFKAWESNASYKL